MTTRDFKDFCNRWLKKADSQGERKLNDIFDEFLALYIVYNALYSQLTTNLNDSLKTNNKDLIKDDKSRATKLIPEYLNHKQLAKRLTEDNDVLEAIKKILRCLDNTKAEENFFVICFLRGKPRNFITTEPDIETQNILVEKAENIVKNVEGNEKESTEKLLEIIYQIRCNMFHGQKSFSERQRYLLEPTIVVIRKVIGLTLEELEKS